MLTFTPQHAERVRAPDLVTCLSGDSEHLAVVGEGNAEDRRRTQRRDGVASELHGG